MPKPTPTPEIPANVKAAAERKARELGGKQYYITWNDVRYGPFLVPGK